MEQVMITGVAAAGTIDPPEDLAVYIKTIEIDLPQTHIGRNDPAVTISGNINGATTIYGDTTLDKLYSKNETLNLTTTNFSGEYSAIIRYLYSGDMGCAMKQRKPYSTVSTPWRFR